METVIADDDALRIVATAGDTDTAIVSFSGIEQRVGSVPREEFVKTLRGTRHWQFFVVDKQRSWYTGTGADIARLLPPLLARFRKVVTLGNSMGGYGAILFASRLQNCAAAIAFAPQFSVDPRVVPSEKRWREYRAKIVDWPQQHLLHSTPPNLPLHIFFGARERADEAQRALLKQHATARTFLYTLPRAAHDPARSLRDKGLLAPTLDAVIMGDAGSEAVRSLLSATKVPYAFWSVNEQHDGSARGLRGLFRKLF